MEISFVKLSPTQNVTVLATSPVPRAEQPAAAAKLLAYDGVGGEQAGFLEKPAHSAARARLQMMGGEFCGNAAMSLGAYLARRDGLADGASEEYLLEVSGAEGLVPCRVERRGDAFAGTVRMPLPTGIGRAKLPCDAGEIELARVDLPGITHLVAPMDGLSREEIQRRIRQWNGEIRAEALGVLRWDEAAGRMEPIVYVPETDSAVWERGCGSGTAALGAYLARRAGRTFQSAVRQPGGEIVVRAELDGEAFRGLTITGDVRITAEGTAFV